MADITYTDIEDLHHKLQNTPYQANRSYRILRAMFNWAEKRGLRERSSNPAQGLQEYKEVKRKRYLSHEEFSNLLQVLEERESAGLESPYVAAAFRLLMHTGCRLGEIQTLKWEYVDFSKSCLKLPDSKTGEKWVYVGHVAMDILRVLRREAHNPYVIASEVKDSYVNDLQKPWRRIRAQAGIDDVRIHDLRHTFASFAIMNGTSLTEVGKLLGHTQAQTTMRYTHLSDQFMQQSANRVADVMANLHPKADESNVLHFRPQ